MIVHYQDDQEEIVGTSFSEGRKCRHDDKNDPLTKHQAISPAVDAR
jgi:hypothetical protein